MPSEDSIDRMTARERRQAEINAMTQEILNSKPSYSIHKPENVNSESPDVDIVEESEDGQEEISKEDKSRKISKRLELPISHEACLKGHYKAVTALSVDPGGGRVATGGTDYKIRLYDFGGMDKHHRSFREIEPEEGHVVAAISHSPSGGKFLTCTGSSQPKVYDRDGIELAHFVKGDPYIRDLRQTKGHVTVTTCGQWHPLERHMVMTGSMDGTVRIWDLNGRTTFEKLMCNLTLRVKPARAGGKVQVTAATYCPEAKSIAIGGNEGSIRIIPAEGGIGGSTTHGKLIENAHGQSVITSLVYHDDGHILASRGTDDCVRLWDVRKFKNPIRTFKDVETHLETSNMAFSPDGRTIAIGTNVDPRSADKGQIKFFEVYGSEESVSKAELQICIVNTGESVIRIVWHSKLKQIIAATSGGYSKVLYDPLISSKGALMTSERTHRSIVADYVPDDLVGVIHNPYALPMFREEHSSKRRMAEKARKDPKKSKKPDPPVNGPGAGGRVRSSNTFTQFVMENKLLNKPKLRDQDAREELLRFAKETEDNPEYFGGAYAWNKAPLAEKTLEKEEADFEEEQRKLVDS